MSERERSATAVGVAALRAAHQLLDGEPKILDDPVIVRLMDAPAIERLRANAAGFAEPRAAALRAHVVARSRYAEDALANAVRRGVRQHVMLGAGLDTFPYRQPTWARDVTLFEVDHPASQRAKHEKLAAAGVTVPANVRYVEADFERDSIADRLASQGFQRDEAAMVSCLGVLVYLDEATVNAVFTWVASLAEGSEFVFTYTSPDSATAGQLATAAAALGEPWKTHFEPGELDATLRALGFSDVRFPTVEQLEAWYFRGRTDGFGPPRRARIAHAIVGPHHHHEGGVQT